MGPRFVRIERKLCRPYLYFYFLINMSHFAIYTRTTDVHTAELSFGRRINCTHTQTGKEKKHILLFSRGYGKLDYT